MRRAPSKLKKDGRKAWEASVQFLTSGGVLQEVDYPLLEEMCFAIDMIKQAQLELYANGIITEHTNKVGASNLQSNPAVTIFKHFYDVLERCSKKFGFNPLDRSKLSLQEDDFDPLAELSK